jgi:thimet oligopeptidase
MGVLGVSMAVDEFHTIPGADLLEFYNRAAPSSVDVLAQMLSRRGELARLLGYSDWADYITEDKMVQSAANANAFLDKIREAARGGVESEPAA